MKNINNTPTTSCLAHIYGTRGAETARRAKKHARTLTTTDGTRRPGRTRSRHNIPNTAHTYRTSYPPPYNPPAALHPRQGYSITNKAQPQMSSGPARAAARQGPFRSGALDVVTAAGTGPDTQSVIQLSVTCLPYACLPFVTAAVPHFWRRILKITENHQVSGWPESSLCRSPGARIPGWTLPLQLF